MPTVASVNTQNDSTATTTPGFVDIVKASFLEGAKRAPVEVVVDKGHDMIKETLISLAGSESLREEGIIREYVTKLLESDYGKALCSYGIAGILHTAAPYLGKRASLAQAASREFANRAATVTVKGTSSHLLSLIPKGVGMINKLLDNFAGVDSGAMMYSSQHRHRCHHTAPTTGRYHWVNSYGVVLAAIATLSRRSPPLHHGT